MTVQTHPRKDLPKAYDPRAVEQRCYGMWEQGRYFTPKVDRDREPFTITMPPPNVSGDLHIGSAMFVAIEDILTRWHRMKGDPTLWLPGEDHAAIATQNVVERELAKEGLSRHDLGREAFLERVWEWALKYRGVIAYQLRRLGASCDWTRERFTMDPGPRRAVATTFVNLYNDGLIYRGERIINWCPRCQTALSELEVEHVETHSHLWYVRYPLLDDEGRLSDEFITIATTRPETIVADTGVAVNPHDKRLGPLVGRKAQLPIIGRELPIVADEAIDPEFGAGALKVTPGHDPVDFDIGQRHGLPTVSAIALDATMTAEAGPYEGMDRLECRQAIVRDLEKLGYLVKIEPYVHSIGHCQRCNTLVEPLISPQWFVRMEPLAKPAIEAVASGRIRFVPERFTRLYMHWMENIRDWCISRQLWFGHPIPVWYCDECDALTVSVDEPSGCQGCGSARLRRDPDVLDTWFSSALWPHSTLGWPDQTEDLAYFYPTSVMETAYDILFFWVSRMIFMGLYNMKGHASGEEPFRVVYLHGLVRTEQREKISKSKVGHAQAPVLELIEAIDRYGADALRYALATGGSPGNDMRISEQRLEAGRNFANKLWNAARYVISRLDTQRVARPALEQREAMALEDRWILSRLHRLVASVEQLLESYQFGEAGRQIHDFLWGEYCDWYVEMSKVRLARGDNSALPVLVHVLETGLRLLHPYMPFVTEELWQTLSEHLADQEAEALIVSPYPHADGRWHDEEAERQAGAVMDYTRAIRNIRSEKSVDPSRLVEAYVVPQASVYDAARRSADLISALARACPLHVVSPEKEVPSEAALTSVLSHGQVVVPLAGLFDLEAERARLTRQVEQVEGQVSRLGAKLADERFRAKAPPHIVAQEEERLAAARSRLEGLRRRLAELGQEQGD